MLHVACVRWGQRYDAHYVEVLHDMVRRNLPAGFKGRFVCFTDCPEDLKHLVGVETQLLPPGLSGWWNKLALFKPGAFPAGDTVLYLDLDVAVVGPLDKVAELECAFGLLHDIFRGESFASGCYQSSIIAFKAETKLTAALWEEFLARRDTGVPDNEIWPGGDQEFFKQFWARYLPERIKGRPWPPECLQTLFPGFFPDYKLDAVNGIPSGAAIVYFHGHPRPHEITVGWVPEIWRVGGGTKLELVGVLTVPGDKLLANVRANLASGLDVFAWEREPVEMAAVLCAGGPSLKEGIPTIASLQRGGALVISMNGTERFLREHGIHGNMHVMLDGRPAMKGMHCTGGLKLYASQMDPEVIEHSRADPGATTVLWHSLTTGINDVVPQGATVIGFGTTVGVRSLALAYAMGFRKFICFGYDSSLVEAAHHAYPQPLNDGDPIYDVLYKGRKFRAASWMIQQAEDFCSIAHTLIGQGCSLTVFGEGLLPWRVANLEPPAAEQRAQAVLQRLRGFDKPVGVEVGVFTGDMSKQLLARTDLTLYLVDSWAAADPQSEYARSGDWHAQLTQAQQERFREQAERNVAFAGDRARFLRMTSAEAASHIPPGSLDFVFIDADHSYEGCRADILAWLPKVRQGGWICGHDYENTEFPRFGVKRAVDELFPAIERGDNFTWFKKVV